MTSALKTDFGHFSHSGEGEEDLYSWIETLMVN